MLLGGRAEAWLLAPALGTCPQAQPALSHLLPLGQLLPPPSVGRRQGSFSKQTFHFSEVLSTPLSHDRGSTFPVSHLPRGQGASSAALHTHEHTCIQVKGWGGGGGQPMGAWASFRSHSAGSEGLPLLREEGQVRASTGFTGERGPPLPKFQPHPSPNPCTASQYFYNTVLARLL